MIAKAELAMFMIFIIENIFHVLYCRAPLYIFKNKRKGLYSDKWSLKPYHMSFRDIGTEQNIVVSIYLFLKGERKPNLHTVKTSSVSISPIRKI